MQSWDLTSSLWGFFHNTPLHPFRNLIKLAWIYHLHSGEGNGSSLQYSCLENPMDRGAWQAKSIASQRVRHNWATNTHTHITIIFIHFLGGIKIPVSKVQLCCTRIPQSGFPNIHPPSGLPPVLQKQVCPTFWEHLTHLWGCSHFLQFGISES